MTPVCHSHPKRPQFGLTRLCILSFFLHRSWDRPVVLSLGINQSVTSASFEAQSMRHSCTFGPIAVIQPALFQSSLQLSDPDPVSSTLYPRATLNFACLSALLPSRTSGQTRARSSCHLSTWPNCSVLHIYPLEEAVGCSKRESCWRLKIRLLLDHLRLLMNSFSHCHSV